MFYVYFVVLLITRIRHYYIIGYRRTWRLIQVQVRLNYSLLLFFVSFVIINKMNTKYIVPPLKRCKQRLLKKEF